MPIHRKIPVLVGAATLALAGSIAAVPAQAIDAEGNPEAGDNIVIASGSELTINAVNPPNRTSGMIAVYTADFGATTGTNAWGAEALLVPADEDGQFVVKSVCTAFGGCADDGWRAGNNPIPTGGFVLSISPGGNPDARVMLRDEVAVGDVVTVEEVVSRTARSTISITDPTADTNPAGVEAATGECYPGCRGTDQLIRYTPEFDAATTGTNDYGFEVVVVDGVIVEAGGNDSAIPQDGYVLSGHGSAGSWLQTNAVVGARVTIDGDQVTIVVDEQSTIFRANQLLGEANARYAAATDSCLRFPETFAEEARGEAARLIEEARAASAAGKPSGAIELAERAGRAAQLAGYRSVESRTVEGRVTWVRPEATTEEGIKADLDRIKAAGFNVVLLETIYQGTTIYPSSVAKKYGITAQRPSQVGHDPLEIWVREAHARGIEVHPWVHTFFVGSDAATAGPGPVLSVHPEWAAVEREDVGADQPMPSSQEPGYYFLDAAHPEARQYVQRLLAEMIEGYDIDGIHLDYIRYPVSQPWETAGYSYSDVSRAAFEAEHGVDPYTLTPDDEQWTTWTKWRVAKINSFVEEASAMVEKLDPTLHLSAAVFANPSDGLDKKFQDWGHWADEGWVDMLTGMSFGTSATSVGADTEAMRERVGDHYMLYTATYGPFRGTDSAMMLDQVAGVINAGSDGAGLFSYTQLTDEQALALSEGAFREQALIPHADRAAALREGLSSLAADLEHASGKCLNRIGADKALATLVRARAAVATGDLEAADIALREALDHIANSLFDKSGSEAFGARTARDGAQYLRWIAQLPSGGSGTEPADDPSTEQGSATTPIATTTPDGPKPVVTIRPGLPLTGN